MKLFSVLACFFVMAACSTGPCKTSGTREANSMAPSSAAERIKVYKADGSLQCGQGKQIPVAEMQKQLKDIQVYSAVNKNDGMMRIQVCGSPTGNCNVYEIERKDLETALKAGFKEWAGE